MLWGPCFQLSPACLWRWKRRSSSVSPFQNLFLSLTRRRGERCARIFTDVIIPLNLSKARNDNDGMDRREYSVSVRCDYRSGPVRATFLEHKKDAAGKHGCSNPLHTLRCGFSYVGRMQMREHPRSFSFALVARLNSFLFSNCLKPVAAGSYLALHQLPKAGHLWLVELFNSLRSAAGGPHLASQALVSLLNLFICTMAFRLLRILRFSQSLSTLLYYLCYKHKL